MLVGLVVLTFNMSIERLEGVHSTHNLRDGNSKLTSCLSSTSGRPWKPACFIFDIAPQVIQKT